jgi:hypothetical protein
MNWRERDYCGDCPHNAKKYQLVIMDCEGKTTYGKTFKSWPETFEAMMELRNIYAKNEINHHVGYREV